MTLAAESPAAPRLALPALIVGVIAIACAAVLFKLAQPTHPLVASGFRLGLSGLLLLPLTIRAWRQGRLRRNHVLAGMFAGVMYACHFGAWVWSLELTSVAASTTLVCASPLFLALWGWLSGHDRPTGRLWLALAVAFAGVLIIAGHDLGLGPHALLGDLLALLGALTVVVYFLLVRRLGPALDAWAFLGVATASAGIGLYATAWAVRAPLGIPSWSALGYLVAAAVIAQLIGHGALTWVLRHLSPTTVGIANLAEPVVASLLAWVVLGEPVTATLALGGTIVLGGVAIALGPRPAASR